MNILLWILFGALAGWIASLVMKNDASQDILMDIVMGIAGALVGGFLMQLFGVPGVTGFNLYSLLVAVVGASILIYLGRLLRRSA
ncbi:MAG: transglycosylase [Candidatus Gottesmanbacteria bacterium GW2011_GWA2_43_14]|uniref:Transglycosylase n=1 Tax=Candidatus Gottesmanbacteria bacterium GW2011_GWA2_43_14 TaxID=1618443 RepID=A0A0G1DJX7_9BACT|nr:MAG: transglycosylase [Candidatus Gottesmanbacteria bacterium GW2011_GWA2_43_14]